METQNTESNPLISPPSSPRKKENASYGALISIVIILALVVVGAFYSWGKRIEQNQPKQPAQTGVAK